MMKLIERKQYLDFLRNHRYTDAIIVVSGIRRCGKSTLFQLYKEELLAQGVQPEQIVSINFEDLEYEHLQEYRALYKYILERLIPHQEMYIFLDEIQHVPNFEKVVDSLYIKDKVKVYITGSNAYFMSSEMATLLSGRYVQLDMLPLSFKEFCEAHGNDEHQLLEELYQKYIQYSSFPGTLTLGDNLPMILDYLQGIFNTIVLKDIITRSKIGDPQLLESVARYLFANIGSLINPTKIKNSLISAGRKVDGRTIERYLSGLKDALLMYQVNRYDIRGKEVLQLNAKYYAADVALKQFLLPNRGEDTGHILENIVFLELIRRGYKVYVGHLQKGEIDFIAQKHGTIEYYQVSQSVLDPHTLERELKPLKQIQDHYPKFLLTFDVINKNASYNGIQQKHVLEWLLDTPS